RRAAIVSDDYSTLWSSWDPWRSIPAEYNLGVGLTHEQVRRGHGSKAALLWENAAGESRTLSYAQLDALSNRFAAALDHLGIKRGERVFLRLPNVPEFYIASLAIAKLGAVFIPSSTQFRSAEVAYRLKDAGCVAAITTKGLVEAIDQAGSDCPELRHV